MQHDTTEVDARFRTMMILWLVLLMSQVMFFGVVFVIRPEILKPPIQPMLGENPLLVLLFGILAFMNIAVSFFLRKRAQEQAILERKMNHVSTGLIIACAVCESISLMGFVLAIAFGYQYFFFWFIIGIIGIFMHFPRRQHLLEAIYGKQ